MKAKINIINIKNSFGFESVGILPPNKYTKTPIILGIKKDGRIIVLFHPYINPSVEITPTQGVIINKNQKTINLLSNLMPSIFKYVNGEDSFTMKIAERNIYSNTKANTKDNLFIYYEDIYEVNAHGTQQFSKI